VPPPPGRPAFTTLRSSGQGVHVHRTNIAPVALAGGNRWRCIWGPFRRVVEADVGEDCLAQVSASEARSAQIGGRQISAGHVGVAEARPSQIGRRQINEASCSILRSRSCGVQPAMSFLIARNTLSVRRPSATAFSSSKRLSRFHHAM
jgi:hypothetical protein